MPHLDCRLREDTLVPSGLQIGPPNAVLGNGATSASGEQRIQNRRQWHLEGEDDDRGIATWLGS